MSREVDPQQQNREVDAAEQLNIAIRETSKKMKGALSTMRKHLRDVDRLDLNALL